MSNPEKKQQLPPMLEKYFWDVKFSDLSMQEYDFYITERLLNHGDTTAIKWVLKNASKKLLKTILRKSRQLNKKTRSYWSFILDIPPLSNSNQPSSIYS